MSLTSYQDKESDFALEDVQDVDETQVFLAIANRGTLLR